jgi:hypothetical protein
VAAFYPHGFKMKPKTRSRAKVHTKSLTVRKVLFRIQQLEAHLDGLEITPATSEYRTGVILPLLSKALTVGRAVCSLVKSGFPGEAFGLSRTLVDIFLYVRYLSNKDTEERATKFIEYQMKIQERWVEVYKKYYPHSLLNRSAPSPEELKIAKKFSSPYRWTEHSLRFMAREASSWELDEQGQPLTSELDYDGPYFLASHYVHSVVAALDAHAPERGVAFRVRCAWHADEPQGDLALFYSVQYLLKTFMYAFHGMNDEAGRPQAALQALFKLMKEFGGSRNRFSDSLAARRSSAGNR